MNRSILLLAAVGCFLAAPLVRAEDEAPTAIRVTVTGADGAPLSEARVLAWDGERRVAAVTDGAGEARVAGLGPGRVVVFATKEGHVADESRVTVPEAGADVVAVGLDLEVGVPFGGRVLDAQGEPVAGAYLEVMPGGAFEGFVMMYADRTPYDRLYADDEGRFRVRGIPRDGIATLLVRIGGYREARVGVKSFGDAVRPSPLVIRLDPGARIRGVVKDPEGRPVAGADVFAVPADDAAMRRNPRIVRSSSEGATVRALTARTDASGAFALDGIALGEEYAVLAEADGFPLTEAPSIGKATADRPIVEAEVVLAAPGTLRLRIVDEEGHPVRGAEARIGGGGSAIEAEEEAPGLLALRGLATGAHVVAVECEGYLNQRIDVVVKGQTTTERLVELDPGAAIGGVLVDTRGDPVPAVSVEVEWWEPTADGWRALVTRSDKTDPEGRFEIRGLPPGEYEISVRGTGFDLPEPVKASAPTAGLRLEGRRLGTVRVRLKTPTGDPLPEQVFVWRDSADGSGEGSGQFHDQGLLEFRGFDGKKTRLRIQVEGYVETVIDLEVDPGEERDLGEIVLDPGVNLRGVVTDLGGVPVPGAQVEYGDLAEATTSADGHFVLEHVPAGRIEVSVDAEDFLPLEEKAEAGDDAPSVRLRLHRGALLEGVLRDEEAVVLEAHWVRVEWPRDGKWKEIDHFRTAKDGTFAIRVPAVACRVAYYETRESEPKILAELDLKEGETRRLELVLPGV